MDHAVDELVNPFWSSTTRSELIEVYDNLIQKGLSADDAFNIIERVWSATKREYGE